MRMFILVPAFEIGNHVLRPVRLCNENDAVTGGKDGVLPYDGFTVYTLVQPDGTETVYDVEKN